MGRGRAKAKQTKVARELKYNAPQTDFDALRAELTKPAPESRANRANARDDDDPYSKYADDEGDASPHR